MVEWLAGNRIRGTNAQRTSAPLSAPSKTIDGNYTVLTYTENGKFIPRSAFNVEYLVVGGGGGGGGRIGGGGGAGGFQTNFGGTALGLLTAQPYSITVGKGGSGGDGNNVAGQATNGTNGNNSSFSTITSLGGGGGGTYLTVPTASSSGNSGGSGGGGGGNSTGGAGGGSTANGNNGGTGTSSASSAGGGGGAGAVGGNGGNSSTGGVGGVGLSNSITGSAVYYAGGGGGSADSNWASGGNGGGGQGGNGGTAGGYGSSGGASTGGGGGGTRGDNSEGASGGSGVVILRFLTSGNEYDLLNEIGNATGGWVELARTTLGTAGDVIDVTGLADKRYLMVLTDARTDGSGNILAAQRYNGDGAYNYQWRYSVNGGGDGVGNIPWEEHVPIISLNGNNDGFAVSYIANKSDKEKLVMSNSVLKVGSTGSRTENTAKWTNKSEPINRIYTFERGQSGKYAIGSEVVVLGWDSADTHSTNFWEELASVELSSSNTTIDSGTISAKKYLMYQIFAKKSTSGDVRFRFNGDTDPNYAQINSFNGAENPYTGQTMMNIGGDPSQTTDNFFGTGFIVNNSGNEKLLTGIGVWRNTTGSGQIGNRVQLANRWTNTSSQITSIQAVNTTFDSGSILKVWGSN